MRKFFFIFAGLLSLPTGVTHHGVPAASYQSDPRLAPLRKFFARMDCPVFALSDVFLQAADMHGLDWRLLPSISFVESTGGKNAPNNNLFGWGNAQFPSLSAAIRAVAWNLGNSDLYKDKNIDEMLWTYNPDADYARRVKSVMARISPSEEIASEPEAHESVFTLK